MAGPKGSGESQATNTLASLSEQLFKIWSPMQGQASKAGQDIFSTGGTNSLIPLIQQIVQGLKSGLSKTMTATEGKLGQVRQAGTPFGQRLLTQTQLEGESNIAMAGPNAAMQLLQMLLPASTQSTNAALSGLGSASQGESRMVASQNEANAQVLSAMIPKTSINYGVGGH